MRVKATKPGFYGGVRRRVGDVFEIRESPLPPDTPEVAAEAAKEAAKAKTVKTAQARPITEAKKKLPHDFSEKWMEPVSADTPTGSVKDQKPEGRPADQPEPAGKAKPGAKVDRPKAGAAGRKAGQPARPAPGAKKGENADDPPHGRDPVI